MLFLNLLYFNYYRIIDPAAFAKLDGAFEDLSVSEKLYDDISNHPLQKFLLGSLSMRTTFLNHPEVDALLFISKGKLYQLNLPKIVQEFDDNEIITKVCGVLGKSVQQYSPVSFTDNELLGNFWTFMNETLKHHFIVGTVIDKDSFKSPPSDIGDGIVHIDASGNESGNYQYPCTPPVIIGSVPICIPKLKGVRITTGSLKNDTVLESLRSYHELAAQWADLVLAHKKAIKYKKANEISNTYWPSPNENDPNTHLYTAMATPTIEEGSSIALQAIENDIQLIKSVNKKAKSIYNPYQTPEKILYSSPIPPQSADGAVSVASTTTTVVKEKNVRTIAFYKIFFSTREYNENTKSYDLTLGDVSEDFMEALEASSKTEQIAKFKTALDTRVIEKTTSESFLDRSIELPNFSDTFVALLMNCLFHKHLLDQHEDLIKQRVSVLNFLPKPEYGQSKEEYNKYIYRNHASEMEGVVDEAVEKRAAKDKTVFTKGRQETLPDIVTALANLILVLEFLSGNDSSLQVPGILRMLYKIASKITTPDFRDFYNAHKQDVQWIPYYILCHIQSIMKAHVLAASDVNTLRYVENDNTPDYRILSSANQQFNYILDNYELCVHTNTLGFFAPRPSNFIAKRKNEREQMQPYKKDRPNSDSQNNTGATKKGWLVATENIKFPDLKHSKRPCLFFILEGRFCKKRGHECSYEHKTYPRGFKRQDQATICKWVADTPGVNFSSLVLEKDRHITWTPAPSTSKADNDEKSTEGEKKNDADDDTANEEKNNN